MTYTEMKRSVYGITAAYFSSATVEMANTKSTKKGKPLIKLAFGPAQSTQFPVEQFIDGELCSFYPTTAKLEVQLFTNGSRLPNGAMENTAVGDLTDYVNYMMSEMVTNELNTQNLSMLVAGPVQDVTAIINDCQRRCDFVVFRRTGYVEKWRVMVYSLCIIILAVFVRQA